MKLLSVQGVGKAYRTYASEFQRIAQWFYLPAKHSAEHWIIRDINFEIRSGESIGIVGQNGAGKSTLLKMITGTLQPTEGDIQRHGKISAILELGMGFSPELTGRANVIHTAGLMGYSAEQIDSALVDIELFSEIGEYFDEPVRTYSSGMQMRVAFAVATAFRPDILIVDEALSVGDAYFQAKCYKRIAEFKALGTALVLVSHSPGDVVKHCERAIMLKDGRVIMDGPSREVTNRYLDELFGKPKAVVVSGDENLTPEGAPPELSDLDEFHTRPGYNKSEYRWGGQRDAAILDYVIRAGGESYPSQLPSNSTVNFYFKVRFDVDHDSVVPGFLLKTIEGIFLYGTNSFHATANSEVISVRAGEVRTFCFSIAMDLQEGPYLVSLGISAGHPATELVPLDRRYDSIMINVQKNNHFTGLVDLKSSFSAADRETGAHDE